MSHANDWLTAADYECAAKQQGLEAAHQAYKEVGEQLRDGRISKSKALHAFHFRAKKRKHDEYRKLKNFRRTHVDQLKTNRAELDAETINVIHEAKKAIREAVDDLPELLRDIIVLKYFKKLSTKQISNALAIPLKTVYEQHDRAIKQLKWHQGINPRLKREIQIPLIFLARQR